ncbi:MAG TPA: hypothetical protein VNX68_08360, partial [Nitrosopumilaceae archaeon]|nr:hypothetical protein [Nitrosopumilaceae archaeon]
LCPGAIVKKGTVHDFEFEGIKFDKLLSNSVFLLLDSLEEAENALNHFCEVTTPNGWVYIGDIPMIIEGLDENKRRRTKSLNMEVQHFPVDFFDAYCTKHNYKGQYIKQIVPGKESTEYRYDYLIIKK